MSHAAALLGRLLLCPIFLFSGVHKILFLIPTTFVFHDFWTFEKAEQMNQMQHFMKNVTILGGLFVLAGLGPGACSIDGARARRTSNAS